MSLVSVTTESLGQQLGREIPDAHLLIAKNSVLGLDAHGIADILGVSVDEVQEVEESPEYKEVRLLVAAMHNSQSVETDLSWDALENKALGNLMKRVDYEKDVETNLKIAALANRAQRRHSTPQNRILDAGALGDRVNLTLTKRLVERFMGDGGMQRETTQELSIRNGNVSNPSFDDVDRVLGVSARPRIPANLSFKTSEPELDSSALEQAMDRSLKK